jgi:hypothetical protein
MPALRRTEAEKLVRRLERLESLSGTARSEEADALLARYLKLPVCAAA